MKVVLLFFLFCISLWAGWIAEATMSYDDCMAYGKNDISVHYQNCTHTCQMSWEIAHTFCKDQGGYLPTIEEISDIDYAQSRPKGFLNSAFYWTATQTESGAYGFIIGCKHGQKIDINKHHFGNVRCYVTSTK